MPIYSREEIRTHFSRIDHATTSNEKGDTLERFIKFFFENVPGITFYANDFLDYDRTREIDLAFKNKSSTRGGMHFLEPAIIIECKNTVEAIGSLGVGDFARKIRGSGQKIGILISLNGITGDPILMTNAYGVIRDEFIRDQTRILILNREEIESIRDTKQLVEILERKYYELGLKKHVV